MGKWHPNKEIAELLWKRYCPSVFAPCFHALFPTTTCYEKPKLLSLQVMYSYCLLAYPEFARELRDTIAEAEASNNRYLSDLLNLQDLFEIYLPTVCAHVHNERLTSVVTGERPHIGIASK